MDIQIEGYKRMMAAGPAPNMQEQQSKMMVQQAEDEDLMFETTGMELRVFNAEVLRSGLNKDPRF